MAVLYPLESRMHQTKSRAKKIILVVWVIPCFVASPFLYPSEAFSNTLESNYGVISRLTCFIVLPENFRRGYYTFLFVFIYLLPLTFIAGTCFQVARCLLKDIPVHRQGSIRRQEANRRKVAKMVLMVVLAFAVSWTPYFLVSIVTQYQAVNFMERHNFFFTMLSINLFAFLNSCVNPFIYVAMSARFRNGFRRFFRYFCILATCHDDQEEMMINMTPSVVATGAVEKRVRFRCQVPMSCLVTHSSSDSGSGGQSDASQRTAATTVDQKGGSILKSLLRKRTSQKIIVQYIKTNGQTKYSEKLNTDTPSPKALLNLRISEDISEDFQVPKRIRKSSSSTGDITFLHNDSDDSSPKDSRKKSLSCVDIQSYTKDVF